MEAMFLGPNGDFCVVARRDGTIVWLDLWPARPRKLLWLGVRPTALAVSSDLSLMAVASATGLITVCPIASPESTLCAFVSKHDKPTALALSDDGQLVAVGTEGGRVEVWKTASGTRVARYPRAHTYEVRAITFSHQNQCVTSAESLQIKEWDIRSFDEIEVSSEIMHAAGTVMVSSDSFHAIAVLEDGRLGVWNMASGSLETALPHTIGPAFGDPDIGPPTGLALATSSHRVLAWNDKLLCVWDIEAGSTIGSIVGDGVRDAEISPNGTVVVYAEHGNVMRWESGRGVSLLGTYDGDPPSYIAISPDGVRALSSGGDRRVFAWRLDDARSQALSGFGPWDGVREFSWLPPSMNKPSLIAFAGPEAAVVATGDGSLYLLHMNHQNPARFTGWSGSYIDSMLVTADAKFVIASTDFKTIGRWDVATLQCIDVFDTHAGTIMQLSASGERVLLLTRTGVLKIVSLCDGSLVAAFQGDKQIVSCAANPELHRVVARDQGGTMHFLQLETC